LDQRAPFQKKAPTVQQLTQWHDAKEFGVWINTKRIKNSELSKYKPDDFSWYNVSKLYGAAKKNVDYSYQVSLYTKNSDMEKLIDKAQKDWQDTTKMLMVVNNTIYSKIKKEDIDRAYPPHTIERITVLKDKAAIAKYGEMGRYGVIEVTTKPSEVKKVEVKLFDTTKSNNSLKEVVVTGYPSQVSNEPLFEKVETEPGFPGGETAWRKYLEKNLNALVPTNNGAKEGTYKVQIKFLVDKEGDITSINALTHHGYGMEEEVIRVIAKGPKWIPAKQNGHIVNAYKTQPVTFVIVDDVKDKKEPIITNSTKKE
jgi:TonB-dependent SusC/RagA subfamily outer membrane receptor